MTVNWAEFEGAAPELAAFGRDRLAGRVSYLATVRADGGPRVHPVTPQVGGGRLYVYMEPTSPKGHDLHRDPRFALHGGVEDNDGGSGEFIVHGRAELITDPHVRAECDSLASYTPRERYILFELRIERALGTTYSDDGPIRKQWRSESK